MTKKTAAEATLDTNKPNLTEKITKALYESIECLLTPGRNSREKLKIIQVQLKGYLEEVNANNTAA